MRSLTIWIGTAWVVCGLAPRVSAQGEWPSWRGPRGDGQAHHAGLPLRWGPKSIAWKTPLKGIGQSSPIVWGNRIFLTSALDEGRTRIVQCFDARDGRSLWEHQAWKGDPEPIHQLNSWASATCATDGEVVVAFFGRAGLHGYSLDGKPLWSRDLGPFEGPWGVAACPVIAGDLVVQNCDADTDARIVGIHKRTGEIVWSTPRPNFRGWSTPISIEHAARRELIVNGHAGVTSYDPATGRQLWFCKSFNGRGEPTITPVGDLLCAVNGLAGDIYAIRPGGDGDVTETHRVWHTPRLGGRDIPSPIVIGRFIVVVDTKGIATCYDSTTGAELWKERLCGPISASPVAVEGMALFLDEAGMTTVLRAGPRLDIVSRNTLEAGAEETFRSSLAAAPGRWFLRSQSVLYAIRQETSP
jgi:outer membrane protein assembly factor BamB